MRGLVAVSMILILAVAMPVFGSTEKASLEVNAELQILDVAGVFGGHITWIIHGELAKELREAIGERYHVKNIDLARASQYFKEALEPVVEKNKFGCGYLGFVRILQSGPLHGDKQGILYDENDVKGLIGPVTSTDDIILRMVIRGEPQSGKYPAVSENLTLAPFYAVVSNKSELMKFHFGAVNVRHTEVIAGFGSVNYPPAFTARLILGMYFTTSGGWVEYSKFDLFNSPIVLFAVFLVGVYISKLITKNKDEQKRIKPLRYATNLSLFALYILLPLYGLYYFIIVVGAVFVLWLYVRKVQGE